MKTIMKIAVCVLIITGSFISSQSQDVLDGVYVKENSQTRKVIPYTYLREADVFWMRRIWRVMDLREKMNHTFYFPIMQINNRKAFIDVIKDGIREGTITAYDDPVFDDEFKSPMTREEVEAKMVKSDTNYVENLETGELEQKIVPNEITPDKIKQFWIKEDWFIDKQRSVMEVRIVGISPLAESIDEQGAVRGYQPLFWIYYPEARLVFANSEVFNRQNDSERRTYEDIFWKRMFSSFIRKESNVYNRTILEYAQNINYQLEAEKVKNMIFNMEHDIWNY